LVEQDKLDADALLNNYTATNMTSEDEVESVTLPIFQSFQVHMHGGQDRREMARSLYCARRVMLTHSSPFFSYTMSFKDTFICALMKGHNYEKIWLEPLFTVNSRVPRMCVTMAMVADFTQTSDDPNPHVSVLLRSDGNCSGLKDASKDKQNGVDIVATSDAGFAAAIGPVWGKFVLHCKKKMRQRQVEKKLFSIAVVDPANGDVRGIVARECQVEYFALLATIFSLS
jgi:hypothetical protein